MSFVKNLLYYKNKASNKLTDASKVDENSLKLDKVGPKSTSGWLQFKSTLRIACVAQALVIT